MRPVINESLGGSRICFPAAELLQRIENDFFHDYRFIYRHSRTAGLVLSRRIEFSGYFLIKSDNLDSFYGDPIG